MLKRVSMYLCALSVLLISSGCSTGRNSGPDGVAARERAALEALEKLYSHTPEARQLASTAAGVLVFPEMTKAGFLIGGQYGTGVLFKHGKVAGFYRSTAASYGFQAGVQRFAYALFFMTEDDLSYLKKSEGWEVGVGPTLTVVDEGFAKSISTTTARKGVYVFFFEQRGLMAGIGIQGAKITKTE